MIRGLDFDPREWWCGFIVVYFNRSGGSIEEESNSVNERGVGWT